MQFKVGDQVKFKKGLRSAVCERDNQIFPKGEVGTVRHTDEDAGALVKYGEMSIWVGKDNFQFMKVVSETKRHPDWIDVILIVACSLLIGRGLYMLIFG